jgi:hypothetical protein
MSPAAAGHTPRRIRHKLPQRALLHDTGTPIWSDRAQSPSVSARMNSTSGIGFGSSALQNAQLGISRGMANLSQDAQTIAQDGPVTGALVDAQQQKLDVEASATALSITNQTLGTLLDVTA